MWIWVFLVSVTSNPHSQHFSLEAQRGEASLCVSWALLQTHSGSSSYESPASAAAPSSTGHSGLQDSPPHGQGQWHGTKQRDVWQLPREQQRRECILPRASFSKDPPETTPGSQGHLTLAVTPRGAAWTRSITWGFYHVKLVRIPLSHKFKIRIWRLNRTSHKAQ